jgi:hypothetical protein
MYIWAEHIPNTTFDWNSEKNAFKRAMSKVRQFKSNAAGGKFIEYHGEVTRFEDDDAFIAVRIVIGDSIASTLRPVLIFREW